MNNFPHTHTHTHLSHINSNPSINIYFNILLNGQLTGNDLLFQAHYTSLRLYDFNSIAVSLFLSPFLTRTLHFISFHSIPFNSIPLHCIYATSFMRLHGISSICYMLCSSQPQQQQNSKWKKTFFDWVWEMVTSFVRSLELLLEFIRIGCRKNIDNKTSQQMWMKRKLHTQKSLIKIQSKWPLGSVCVCVTMQRALIYLLISQVGPVHPVAHVQVNSLTGGVDDSTDDTFALLLFNKTLLDSLVGLILAGLPIELIPRIPRRTTTAVVCSIALSPSLRPLLLSYFVGFCERERVHNTHIKRQYQSI